MSSRIGPVVAERQVLDAQQRSGLGDRRRRSRRRPFDRRNADQVLAECHGLGDIERHVARRQGNTAGRAERQGEFSRLRKPGAHGHGLALFGLRRAWLRKGGAW